MSEEYKQWTIPGELLQQVLDRLPDDKKCVWDVAREAMRQEGGES